MTPGTYVLEGGPFDGRRVETDGAHVLRVPVKRPVEIARKVVPFGRDRDLSIDVVEYIRTGRVYRYERLIDDAWSDMDVSAQFLAEGGATVRTLVRQQLRRALEALDPEKEVDRIVWRITKDSRRFTYRVRALVGPRRVERGLHDRAERRAG